MLVAGEINNIYHEAKQRGHAVQNVLGYPLLVKYSVPEVDSHEAHFPTLSRAEMRTIYGDGKLKRGLPAGTALRLASQRKLPSPDNSFPVLSH